MLNQLKQIFELCHAKGLFFNFSPHVSVVTIFSEDMSFKLYSYYSGKQVDLSLGNYKTIPEVLEILKNYVP